MSARWGASNQSWERKRRAGGLEAGLVSSVKAQLSLRQAGNIDGQAEQAAGQGLGVAPGRVEALPGGGGVDGLQVVAAEGRLGDVGAGETHLGQQLAGR